MSQNLTLASAQNLQSLPGGFSEMNHPNGSSTNQKFCFHITQCFREKSRFVDKVLFFGGDMIQSYPILQHKPHYMHYVPYTDCKTLLPSHASSRLSSSRFETPISLFSNGKIGKSGHWGNPPVVTETRYFRLPMDRPICDNKGQRSRTNLPNYVQNYNIDQE